MTLWNRLRTWLRPTPTEPLTPRNGWLNSEIARVEAALRRHRERVEHMDRTWAQSGAPCCPSCMYGSDYTEAVNKVERVEKWLGVLREKAKRSTAP